MTIVELKERLQKEGVSPDVYSLNGSFLGFEGLVLAEHAGKWTLEYCERGMCKKLDVLDSEEAACERMYALLLEYFR